MMNNAANRWQFRLAAGTGGPGDDIRDTGRDAVFTAVCDQALSERHWEALRTLCAEQLA
jgi:hypothetical protein